MRGVMKGVDNDMAMQMIRHSNVQRERDRSVSHVTAIQSKAARPALVSAHPIAAEVTPPSAANTVLAGAPFVQPGEVLGGKFRVGRVIGQGVASVVHEAEHLQLEHAVVVKVLVGRSAAADFERALIEAKATARVANEHVGRVIDIGTTSTGLAYLVMDRLEGHDLAGELRSGPLSIPRAVGLVLEACRALEAVHASGVVHRDIKPANLFLTTRSDGTPLVKILNFGLACLDPARPSGAKRAGMEGSPGYASPEQLGGANVDTRTDIWGLGAVLYTLITGRKPFEVSTLYDTLMAALEHPAPPMTHPREQVPAGLEAIVAKCLANYPEDRFDSVRDLAAALMHFGASESVRAEADSVRASNAGAKPAGAAPVQSSVQLRSPARAPGTKAAGALPSIALAMLLPDRRRVLSFAFLGLAVGLLLAGVATLWRVAGDSAAPAALVSPAPSATTARSLPVAPPSASPSSSALVLLSPLPVKAPPPVKTAAPHAARSPVH